MEDEKKMKKKRKIRFRKDIWDKKVGMRMMMKIKMKMKMMKLFDFKWEGCNNHNNR